MSDKSLYDRLGGIYGIGAVVDDFVDRIMSDPVLNANPKIAEAHDNITPGGFKYYITEFVSSAIGGPQTYTGRTMIDSHAHLKMTNAEWDAFVHDFNQSLHKFDVPEAEQAEIIAVVGSLKGEMGLVD